jgi:cytochrome c2
MPMGRAKTLAPIAATLLIRMAGLALGFGNRRYRTHSQTPPRPVFKPEAHVEGIRIPQPTKFGRLPIYMSLALILLGGAGIYAGYQIKFARDARAHAIALTAGDPDFGRELTQRYGCAGCHTIPGVPRAQGKVGPTLEGFAARVYIGGVVTNTPDNLIRWIEDPHSIDPKSAMPVTGISRTEARHVAAYLYTLQ